MDLLKGSLQTFLNAMTYPDKTIYPVASRNDKDFRNLMDVYLDAVLNPAIYTHERIFRQEGWHYALPDKEADLSLSGVVYNEMRGAYSDPSTVLFAEMLAGLYKDTAYANESGGEPYTIPELTYEDFLDFHKRYYHPSNSYIYLYGDMNVEETLTYIDEEYLHAYDKLEIDSSIAYQEPFTEPVEHHATYSLAEGSPTKDKEYLSWAVVAGESRDTRGSLRNSVLNAVLFDNESAPVKRALAKAGLADDVRGYSEDLQQGLAGVVLINAKDGSLDEFVRIVEETVAEELEKGLSKDELLATLNRIEYSRRECNGYPTRGIIYGIRAYDTWLYDGNPMTALKFDEDFAALRAEVEDGTFEEVAKQIYLDNTHKLFLRLTPDVGLNERKDADVRRQLREKKANMSEEEIQVMVEQYQAFAEWQSTPDSPEAMATIPQLSLEDVNSELPKIPREVVTLEKSGTTHLNHPYFTSGITYFDLSFDFGFVSNEDLPYVTVLANLLGKVSTETRFYEALDTSIYLTSGGIGYSPGVKNVVSEEDELTFNFTVSAKTLDSQLGDLTVLLADILLHSRFDESARIRELLTRTRAGLEQSIVNNGQSYGMMRASSYIRRDSWIREQMGGISYYQWLEDLLNDWDNSAAILQEKVTDLAKRIFTRDRFVSQITADESVLAEAAETLDSFLVKFPDDAYEQDEHTFEPDIRNEGIMTGSNVQYVCQVADFEAFGEEYRGSMAVAATVLSRDYMHYQIRAQGGAYGAGIRIGTDGTLASYSYRDPHIKRTLEVYQTLADQLANNELTDEERTMYIIGSMGAFTPPLTPQAEGSGDLSAFITGRTYEERQAWLDQALATTNEDLARIGDVLRKGFNEDAVFSVVGASAKIREEKDLFGELVQLSK